MKNLKVIDPLDLSPEENELLSECSFPQRDGGAFLVKMPTGGFMQPFGIHDGYTRAARAIEIVAKHGK